MEVIIAEKKYFKSTLLSRGFLTYLRLLFHRSIVQCRVTLIKANGKSLAYINPLELPGRKQNLVSVKEE